MNTNNFLATSATMDTGLVKINNLMHSNYKTEKCDNIDKGWCLDNKRWCHLCTGCYKKDPTKVKPEVAPKSGEKYIIWSRKEKKWRFAPTVNGKSKTIKDSHDLQELIAFKHKYLKERSTNG